MAAPSSLERRLRFHEMLQNGVSPEELVQKRLEHHRQLIDQKIEQIAQALLGRQIKAAEIIDRLIQQLDATDPLEAAKEQNEFLTRILEKLEARQKGLIDTLEPVKKDLDETQEAKRELQETLNRLRGALRKVESGGDPLQSFLFTSSAKYNQYISKQMGVS